MNLSLDLGHFLEWSFPSWPRAAEAAEPLTMLVNIIRNYSLFTQRKPRLPLTLKYITQLPPRELELPHISSFHNQKVNTQTHSMFRG